MYCAGAPQSQYLRLASLNPHILSAVLGCEVEPSTSAPATAVVFDKFTKFMNFCLLWINDSYIYLKIVYVLYSYE